MGKEEGWRGHESLGAENQKPSLFRVGAREEGNWLTSRPGFERRERRSNEGRAAQLLRVFAAGQPAKGKCALLFLFFSVFFGPFGPVVTLSHSFDHPFRAPKPTSLSFPSLGNPSPPLHCILSCLALAARLLSCVSSALACVPPTHTPPCLPPPKVGRDSRVGGGRGAGAATGTGAAEAFYVFFFLGGIGVVYGVRCGAGGRAKVPCVCGGGGGEWGSVVGGGGKRRMGEQRKEGTSHHLLFPKSPQEATNRPSTPLPPLHSWTALHARQHACSGHGRGACLVGGKWPAAPHTHTSPSMGRLLLLPFFSLSVCRVSSAHTRTHQATTTTYSQYSTVSTTDDDKGARERARVRRQTIDKPKKGSYPPSPKPNPTCVLSLSLHSFPIQQWGALAFASPLSTLLLPPPPPLLDPRTIGC